MTPELGAWISTGGAVLIALALCAALFAYLLYRSTELDQDTDRTDRWEANARTSLYSLRSYERRTENVVPRDDD